MPDILSAISDVLTSPFSLTCQLNPTLHSQLRINVMLLNRAHYMHNVLIAQPVLLDLALCPLHLLWLCIGSMRSMRKGCSGRNFMLWTGWQMDDSEKSSIICQLC